MKSKQTEQKRTFVLRLERGEETISSLSIFSKENNIHGASVQGIGALSYARLYSVINSEEFSAKEESFEKPMELISALGNISMGENREPIIHFHVVLGLEDKSSVVGHLLEGKISFTGEFIIQELGEIKKKKEGKLNLLNI